MWEKSSRCSDLAVIHQCLGAKGQGGAAAESWAIFQMTGAFLRKCQIWLVCQSTRAFYQSVGESVKLCPILLVCQFGESLWIVWQQPKDMSLGSFMGLPMNLEWWCWWYDDGDKVKDDDGDDGYLNGGLWWIGNECKIWNFANPSEQTNPMHLAKLHYTCW